LAQRTGSANATQSQGAKFGSHTFSNAAAFFPFKRAGVENAAQLKKIQKFVLANHYKFIMIGVFNPNLTARMTA